tara:strand:+ start:851 stop:1972 length:1122 start_codon:yes stop_codon:yes gene_type:complete
MYDPHQDMMTEDSKLEMLYGLGEFNFETSAFGQDFLTPTFHAWLIDLIEVDKQLRDLSQQISFLDSEYLIQPVAFGSEVVQLNTDPLLDTLQNAFTVLVTIFDPEQPMPYRPSPYVQQFLWAFKECAYLQEEGFHTQPTMTRETAEQTVLELNARLGAWYQGLMQPAFTKQCKRNNLNSLANYNSLKRFISELFAHHNRLLVLRVDLAYSEIDGPGIDYDTARHHREQLCSLFYRHGLFTHLLGFTWKLEWRPKKGFHYHFLFFFDANRVREDVTIAHQIGQLWTQQITGCQGLYHNCNRNAENIYYYNALGEVTYYDAGKRQGLDLLAQYLTKPDEYASMAVLGRRTFQTSHVRRQPEGPRPGRPRQRQSVF